MGSFETKFAAEERIAMSDTKKKRYDGFTEEERSAMRDRVQEQKVAGRSKEEEAAVVEKIAEMKEPDRAMAKRLHSVITTSVPSLAPKLWYGMPAYYKNGKLVCFFQPAAKFKTRYGTLGFSDAAKLDEGNFWPNAYALTKLTPVEEKKIVALVKQAVS